MLLEGGLVNLNLKNQEELERNAGRKAERSSSQDSSSLGSTPSKSSGTSVLNCSKCGSISLVTGSVSCCPSCGAGTNQGPPQPWPNPSTPQGSSTQMRDVACPTCTVHLQVFLIAISLFITGFTRLACMQHEGA
jgi:hypothetical protein